VPEPTPPPPPTETPAPVPEPAPPPPPAGNPDLAQAKVFYRKGLESFQRTQPRGPNTNRYLQEAAANFRKSQRHLETAARQEPDNAEIQSLQVETNRYLYTCLKMQTL
jgi:hypothetical protein